MLPSRTGSFDDTGDTKPKNRILTINVKPILGFKIKIPVLSASVRSFCESYMNTKNLDAGASQLMWLELTFGG